MSIANPTASRLGRTGPCLNQGTSATDRYGRARFAVLRWACDGAKQDSRHGVLSLHPSGPLRACDSGIGARQELRHFIHSVTGPSGNYGTL